MVAFGMWFFFLRDLEGEQVDFAQSVKSTFGEQAEYVNRQANFSIKYPNSWNVAIKDDDEEARGIRIQGRTGYIDLYWGEEYEARGCAHRISELQIDNEKVPVCNFKQADNSEIWNEIIQDQGDLMVWSNAYAASPSASTRQVILDIYSTLTFR